MTFTDALRSGLKNYANFSGRARRSEYWYLLLAVVSAAEMVVAFFGIGSFLCFAICIGFSF